MLTVLISISAAIAGAAFAVLCYMAMGFSVV